MRNFEYGHETFLADPQVKGNVGLVTNATGRDRAGIHIIDRISETPRLRLKSIFTPEHGFFSDAPDGEEVDSREHPTLHIPIFSLYGPVKTPTLEQLSGLDFLVYDIQDVGVRFYTYISTLRNVIDAALKYDIPLHILDRPDILGAISIEGPLLEPKFSSFVGHLPIPIRYGFTPGELAKWWAAKHSKQSQITIWPCRGWRRGMSFGELNVPWVRPSPSMLSTETAFFYPGTCLFEGTNISEGRGTEAPFQILGAPWVDSKAWLHRLNPSLPKHIVAESIEFVPTFSKFKGERCFGIYLKSSQPFFPGAVSLGIRLLRSLIDSQLKEIEFPLRASLQFPFFDYLAGNSWLREGLISGTTPDELVERAEDETLNFSAERKAFFIYDSF